jgi:putative pyruvate formate lyase activating enzyme
MAPMLMEALSIARKRGMSLPIVYNSGGYDALEMLRLWDGIIDIYMPDMKYADTGIARKYSGIPDYPQHNRSAILEMHRQVGDLQVEDDGVAVKGLLVRHLVLPNGFSGTEDVLKFLAEQVSVNTYVSLMRQYFPAFHAVKIRELDRPLTRSEYQRAVDMLDRFELEEGWVQN